LTKKVQRNISKTIGKKKDKYSLEPTIYSFMKLLKEVDITEFWFREFESFKKRRRLVSLL